MIICSIDSSKYTRAARMYERLLRSTDFEIIGIHDASGLAEGYNRGLSQSHGDLRFSSPTTMSNSFVPDFFSTGFKGTWLTVTCSAWQARGRLTSPDWLLPGLPYAYGQMAYPNFQNTGQFAVVMWSVPARRIDRVQAMDGVFLCARRSVAQQVLFDQTNFPGFHLYDSDFTYRAFLAGHKLSIAADLYPLHESGGDQNGRFKHPGRHTLHPKVRPPSNAPERLAVPSCASGGPNPGRRPRGHDPASLGRSNRTPVLSAS